MRGLRRVSFSAVLAKARPGWPSPPLEQRSPPAPGTCRVDRRVATGWISAAWPVHRRMPVERFRPQRPAPVRGEGTRLRRARSSLLGRSLRSRARPGRPSPARAQDGASGRSRPDVGPRCTDVPPRRRASAHLRSSGTRRCAAAADGAGPAHGALEVAAEHVPGRWPSRAGRYRSAPETSDE